MCPVLTGISTAGHGRPAKRPSRRRHPQASYSPIGTAASNLVNARGGTRRGPQPPANACYARVNRRPATGEASSSSAAAASIAAIRSGVIAVASSFSASHSAASAARVSSRTTFLPAA